MIKNIVLITFIITYVIGYKDFFHNFLARIYKVIFKVNVNPLNVKLPKVLECPECCTVWTVLIYLLCIRGFNDIVTSVSISLLASFSVKYVLYVIGLIDLLITKLLEIIENNINN